MNGTQVSWRVFGVTSCGQANVVGDRLVIITGGIWLRTILDNGQMLRSAAINGPARTVRRDAAHHLETQGLKPTICFVVL